MWANSSGFRIEGGRLWRSLMDMAAIGYAGTASMTGGHPVEME